MAKLYNQLDHDTMVKWVEAQRAPVPPAIREAYRRTFSGEIPRVCLAHMLKELSVFEPIADISDVVGSNYGKRLLYLIGINQSFNMKRVVDAMLKMPTDPADPPAMKTTGDMLGGKRG